MKVYELNEESAGVVAELMHRIKPEWWSRHMPGKRGI